MNDWHVALLFFLPAGVSNLIPILVAKVPMLADWNTPLDFGHSYRSHRVFGSHKTWRGLLFGSLFAGLAGILIFNFSAIADSQSLAFWQSVSMGAGALLGDAVESFFKRQRGIGPGSTWFPFDQTDYIIGGLLFALPFGVPNLGSVVLIFGVYFGAHIFFSYLGYLLKLKDSPL